MEHLEVEVVDSYKDAPDYKKQGGWIGITLKKAIVVGKGMQSGAPTVDLQLTDVQGRHYVALVTGNIVEMLAGVVRGKRERDEQEVTS
jgi:hypothetical protein